MLIIYKNTVVSIKEVRNLHISKYNESYRNLSVV